MLPQPDVDQQRDRLRRELAASLSIAEDEDFLQMIWAVDALQNDRADVGRQHFRAVPVEAITTDVGSAHAVHPWELETLANELLATPKDRHYRFLDCKGWNSVVEAVNLLRHLEGAEYVAHRDSMPILREMYRIGGRQFEWQRGFFNLPQFYRNAFVYGQGDCAEYFERTHGITINQMTAIGVALMGVFQENSACSGQCSLEEIGVSQADCERVLGMICAPLDEVRASAAAERRGDIDTAYRPSVLRRFPCVRFGRRDRRIRAPLPELIASRVTSGLFYDVIGGGGRIRADYGRRFEEYAFSYITTTLPGLRSLPEWSYRVAGERRETPDIVGLAAGEETVEFVIECKASRMSFAARFGHEAEGEPGYDDLVKAVFQIWRFISHCRRGLTGCGTSNDAVGVVLTLDSWLVMGAPLRDEVMARATAMAQVREPEITEEDRLPIVFSWMLDLEDVLASATPVSFLSAIHRAGMEDRTGWLLSGVHREVEGRLPKPRSFPFDDDVRRLLPWWRHS